KSTMENFTTDEFSQSTSQKPRIDLDEQPPTALKEEEEQLQQPQQLQQPPTALKEEEQPQKTNLNNQSEALEVQPPQSENAPTKGIFPPFKLPSLFP
ncbi:MAG TPA: hypothetical protein VJ583_02735, partial [Nitrososphaeraceae archaeon]|nr:hypothetical protein [Nitrososphaeraceae archaeon]